MRNLCRTHSQTSFFLQKIFKSQTLFFLCSANFQLLTMIVELLNETSITIGLQFGILFMLTFLALTLRTYAKCVCDPKITFSVILSRIHFDAKAKLYTTRLRVEIENNGFLPSEVCFIDDGKADGQTMLQKAYTHLPNDLNSWMDQKGIYCGGEDCIAPIVVPSRQKFVYFETQVFFELHQKSLVARYTRFLRSMGTDVGRKLVAHYTHPFTNKKIQFSEIIDWHGFANQLESDYTVFVQNDNRNIPKQSESTESITKSEKME